MKEHTRSPVRFDRQYPMGINGTYRQIRIGRILSSIRHHFPYGGCGSLFLVALTVLQTRTSGPPGHVEDILCRTFCIGIQPGSLHLRTVHDLPHRRIHRNHHPSHRHHDCSRHLSERTCYQQKVLGIFVGAMGALILIMNSRIQEVAMAASWATCYASSPKSVSLST